MSRGVTRDCVRLLLQQSPAAGSRKQRKNGNTAVNFRRTKNVTTICTSLGTGPKGGRGHWFCILKTSWLSASWYITESGRVGAAQSGELSNRFMINERFWRRYGCRRSNWAGRLESGHNASVRVRTRTDAGWDRRRFQQNHRRGRRRLWRPLDAYGVQSRRRQGTWFHYNLPHQNIKRTNHLIEYLMICTPAANALDSESSLIVHVSAS